LWHLQRFLQCIKYITLELTPFTVLLYHPLPWFLKQFQQVSWLHLHICVHIFFTVLTLLTLFPATFPFPLEPTPHSHPHSQAGSVLPCWSPIL
jgi:hypothetical protein